MTATLVKAVVALVPTCMLLFGAAIMSSREKSLTLVLQLLGAGALVAVALAHVCEAISSPGCIGGLSTAPGTTWMPPVPFSVLPLFPTGYLFRALRKRPRGNQLQNPRCHEG